MIRIESIKGKIRDLSLKNNLSSQEVLQIYFFERFLERLSKSKYRNNFVLKGGFLISSLIGIKNRTTMDMDVTVKGLPLKKEKIREIINDISIIDVNDGIRFMIQDIHYIREHDEYENFRVSLIANIGKTQNPMKIDITTGDAITPAEINYSYKCIFSENDINIMAYPLETILAEKYESIIKRNVTNTRMRDFYDIYVLYKLKHDEINYTILKKAIIRTANRRGSTDVFNNYQDIINDMRKDAYLEKLWHIYLNENKYTGTIEYDSLFDVLDAISIKIN